MEHKKTIDRKRLIKLVVLTIVVALSIFISFKLLKYVLPFVLAYIFASILRPEVEFLCSKLKLRRGLSTFICVLLFFMVIGTILFFVGVALFNQISSIANNLPNWIDDLSKPLSDITAYLEGLSERFPNLSEEFSGGLNQVSASLMEYLTSLATTIGQFILSKAISIPTVIIFIFMTVLSTYFYTKDRKYFKDLLSKQLPDIWIETFFQNRSAITGTLFRWLRAQGIILSITFTELLIGFSIFRVKYALLLAIIIALIDILPVLGTGTILIPWIIVNFILGNTTLAFQLLVLYVLETSIRQIIEPKIVGHGIGIHPLITLFAMYTGAHFFGVLGFLIGPIFVMIFKSIMLGILDDKRIIEYISLDQQVSKDTS